MLRQYRRRCPPLKDPDQAKKEQAQAIRSLFWLWLFHQITGGGS